jgi:voltage-gated potassium channel
MTTKTSHPGIGRKSIQRRVFEILQPVHDGDGASRAFDIFIVILILMNVIAVALETIPGWQYAYNPWFRAIEAASIVVFTVEYVLRIWSCTSDPHFAHPVFGRLKMMLTPMALVDLAAILPFYLPLLLPFDLRIARALRLMRIFRILMIARYTESLHMFHKVLKRRREELIVIVYTLFVILVVISGLMYLAERDAQPDKFTSIPATMWWGIVTLTTIGYGDMIPITPIGKILGSFITVLGVGLFALPAGLLGSAFVEELNQKKHPDRCPHCGKPLTLGHHDLPGN